MSLRFGLLAYGFFSLSCAPVITMGFHCSHLMPVAACWRLRLLAGRRDPRLHPDASVLALEDDVERGIVVAVFEHGIDLVLDFPPRRVVT